MDVACGMQQWIASSPGFHGEIGLAINGGAACSDDFADISWFQALFLEYVGLFDVGVGGGDFPSSCFAAVGGGDGHAGFGTFGELVAVELDEGGDDGDHCLGHGTAEVVAGSVAMPSRREWNLMPRALKSSRSSSRWLVLRPSRSSFQTMTSSPWLRRSSILSDSGRFVLVPLVPWSL